MIRTRCLPLFVGLMWFASASHSAELLTPETRLVAVPSAATSTEQVFTIATAQDLTVTLTDSQVPAPLTSANVLVTQGMSLVGSASFAKPATSATFDIPGAVGDYHVRVFGVPGSSSSVGTFSVCIAPKSNPTDCIPSASLAGNITAQGSAADPATAALTDNFTVTTGGSYVVSFHDDQFPATLNIAPNVAIFRGSTTVATSIPSGTAVALSPGTYTLLAVAQADPSIKAGLYGITISGPVGVGPVVDITVPVGVLHPGVSWNNPTAQNISLAVTDFAFPTALSRASAVVTAGGALLGTANAGSAAVSFSAPQAPLQVWSYAAPGTDAGTYEVDLNAGGGANLLTTAFGVTGSTSQAYAFVTSSVSAGSYQAEVTDFGIPSNLQGLQFAVAQSQAVLAQKGTAGTLAVSAPNAAPLVVLAAAMPPTAGNGLFGVDVQTTLSPTQYVFDATQGVGANALFDIQRLTVGVSGNFDVALQDLKYPAQLADLALVVSQGGVVLGKIFAGGTFSVAVAPGEYELSFLATPGAGQQFGLYGVQVVSSPPTVTLTATPTNITAGNGATSSLTWSTTNATSCTGAGTGFAGDQPLSSAGLGVAPTATTTYTLTCVGGGGTASATATVTVFTAPAHSGGGGEFDVAALLGLSLLLMRRCQQRLS